MPFGSAHLPYLAILLVIVLVIWGPGKLPDLGAGMGRAIREFRHATSEIKEQAMNATASTGNEGENARDARTSPATEAETATNHQSHLEPTLHA